MISEMLGISNSNLLAIFAVLVIIKIYLMKKKNKNNKDKGESI